MTSISLIVVKILSIGYVDSVDIDLYKVMKKEKSIVTLIRSIVKDKMQSNLITTNNLLFSNIKKVFSFSFMFNNGLFCLFLA
jgi:hypothetical protein